jgi:general secretion pathway protein G
MKNLLNEDGLSFVKSLVIFTIITLFLGIIIITGKMGGKVDKRSAVIQQIKNFETALMQYDNGNPPSTEDGFQALLTDGLIKKIPKDPWGNEYQYCSPCDGHDYKIWSYGADGKEGGRGINKDITSWE